MKYSLSELASKMLGKNIKENYYLLCQQNSNFTSSFYLSESVHSFLGINATKWAKGCSNPEAQSLAHAELRLDDCLGRPQPWFSPWSVLEISWFCTFKLFLFESNWHKHDISVGKLWGKKHLYSFNLHLSDCSCCNQLPTFLLRLHAVFAFSFLLFVKII